MGARVARLWRSSTRHRAAVVLIAVVSTVLVQIAVSRVPATAAVYFNDTEYTYKEYWASHSSYTAGCHEHASAGNDWYIEPDGCSKTITLNVPDNVQNAIAAVIYIDLWRNRTTRSAQFKINDGPLVRPAIGSDFSRDPYSTSIPLNLLRQGQNTIEFQESNGPYHVHDVAVRVYYDNTHPILPGPNSDVTPPTGSLDLVSAGGASFAASAGGTLNVDSNQVTLSASASGAAYVEFHGYYDGYDEDNNGESLDWHSFTRNNFAPGGTTPKATGATIGHIGTDATAPYQATWNLPEVPDQSGVKFKVRIVDAAGNVREAAGGISAGFSLQRSYSVEAYRINGFADAALFFDGMFPQQATRTIDLPADLGNVDRAIMLGNYWSNPQISLNDNVSFPAFDGGQDTWMTSRRELDVSQLRPGSNTIKYSYLPPGFGAMIEKPGPMIVIHRQHPAGLPTITSQPTDVAVEQGRPANFTVTAAGAAPLTYQWLRNGNPIAGAVGPSYRTPALLTSDSGSTYSVVVTNNLGSATSLAATVSVLPSGASSAPWWNAQWDFRVPVTVNAGPAARTDKVSDVLLNFSDLMRAAGSGGPTFDPNSVRVVEVDTAGTVIDADVPVQVETTSTYNAATNAVAKVVFLMKGNTPAGATRLYHVYFDKTSKAIPAPAVTPRVSVSEGTDLGFASFSFATSVGTWVFHKDGGGFSKLLDTQGQDWIAWNPAAGADGDFRGVPNAVKPPAGYFHPGRLQKTTSRILSSGPLKVTMESAAIDRSWITIWEVYPTYATYTLTKAASRSWFLYEGTPGGTVDLGGNDIVVRPDGSQINIDGTFAADLVGEEWVYVGDKAQNRSMFFAHHQDDGTVDSYRLLDGKMPILGFGRGGVGLNYAYLARTEGGEPQRFTVGLTDSTALEPTAATIRGAYQGMQTVLGASQFNGTFGGPYTDDFSGLTLDPVWTFVDPAQNSVLSHSGTTGDVSIPGVGSHDIWTNRNLGPRLLQAVQNSDLRVQAAFSSSPSQAGQGQGLIFQADANNLIRFAAEFDGTNARVSTITMTNGVASLVERKTLPGVVIPRFLRATRIGNAWTFERSYNGLTWFALTTVNFSLPMTQAGVFFISHATPNGPAFAGSVDLYENLGLPPVVDDAPKISNVNVAPGPHGALVTWSTNVPGSSVLDYGSSTAVSKKKTSTVLTTQHSMELGYLECDVPYFVRPASANTEGSTVASLVTFTTTACPTLQSDDFSGATLNPRWRVFEPVGTAVFNLSGTNALLSIPAGSDHNLFAGANRAARLRQDGPIGDFSAEAKFDSVLNARYQLQGVAIEEDEDTFLRFEVHHDGTGTKAYVGSVVDGVGTNLLTGLALPTSATHYVRVARTGNTWTFQHSANGTAWTTVGTFNVALRSSYVSPYVGTTATGTGTPPAFIGSIDYFFNTAAPIVPEDGGAGPDGTPPTINTVVATPGSPHPQAVTLTWKTNEPATSRVVWGPTPAYGAGPLTDNLAVLDHSVTLSPLNCGTTYNYRLSGNDAAGNAGTDVNRTFTMPACPAAVTSDDFSGPALAASWLAVDRAGDGSVSQTGGLLHLHVPGGARHDISPTNNRALRLLQPMADTDFEVEAGLESVVNFNSQVQGLVFEADDNNAIRFDLSSNGTQTRAFVGSVRPAGLTSLAFTPVTASASSKLRVTRAGTTWTFAYSADGTTFSTIYSGSFTFKVARFGPFAGNANPTVSQIPPHTAVFDYVFNTASPIVPEDGGTTSLPEFVLFSGSELDFGAHGSPQPEVNILGRVSDPDGIAALSYQLNGGAPVAMGVGKDGRRLAYPGDFNATVPLSGLVPGANTVTLRAVDTLSNAKSIDVTVNWTAAQTPPMPFSVDWSTVSDLTDVAQPVDGRWKLEGDSVTVEETGYDRLLAFGDPSWSSFEATVPVTINSVDPAGYLPPSGGPGVGFIPHWQGHVDADFMQPHWGFQGRLGALLWYRYRDDVNGERLEMRDSNASVVAEDLSGKRLAPGVTYIFKMRAETGGGNGPRYQLKVWPSGQSEPAAWDLVTQLPPGAPDSGSLLLVAHHVDANFGDLSVTKVTATAPTITPASGTYAGLAKVEMSTATMGGEIRYTVDGSEPTEASPLYEGPFFQFDPTTIRARTFRAGFVPSVETQVTYDITAAPDRVTTGLQALYTFDDGAGTTVRDSSGVGSPADLAIESGATTWLDGGLRIDGASIIKTPVGAQKVNTAVAASGTYTLEAWVDPAGLEQVGATVVGIGPAQSGVRNASLTADALNYRTPLRTANTDGNGNPAQVAAGVVRAGLHHVVVTRDNTSTLRVYVDGLPVHNAFRGGSLAGWGSGYGIGVANLPAGGEPWLGDLYLTAVYSTALTPAQVDQNFRAGPFPPTANLAPVVDAGPERTVVLGESAVLDGTVSDDGQPAPSALSTTWSAAGGPGSVTFASPASVDTTATFGAAGDYTLRLQAGDGALTTFDLVTVHVLANTTAAPPPTITPPGGVHPGQVEVTMAAPLTGSEIRYSTDGSPVSESSTLYSGPFTLTTNSTVKAKAFRAGLVPSSEVTATFTVTAANRVTTGLVAFYGLEEGSGAKIKDTSGFGTPADLTIAAPAKTTWVSGGLRFDSATVATSAGANKISTALTASGAATIEAWVSPANATQSGPAVVVAMSANNSARNFGFGQTGGSYSTRFRTTATDSNGEPATVTAGAESTLQHVVYTRDAAGQVRVYVNGVLTTSATVTGSLSNWVATHRLSLGAERDGSKPWLGTVHLVAIYDRALTAEDVLQNYAVGDA